jgi:methyltransferase (TIGR00027 family)
MTNTTSFSQSALTAAAARAAHLVVDSPPYIFADTLAAALLGDKADELIAYHRLYGEHLVLAEARAQVVVRARVAEDALAASGVKQYVVLGAGLDSYAYRRLGPVRVFEVDHPASQAYKREWLRRAAIEPDPDVIYVPLDLETGSLVAKLSDAGFDTGAPTVVSWLGVTMYLTRDAVVATHRQISGLPAGSQLVFDYMLPAGQRDADGQAYVDAVGAHTAEQGELWRTFLDPDEASALLAQCGFKVSTHASLREAVPEALWQRTDSLRAGGLSMIAHARL